MTVEMPPFTAIYCRATLHDCLLQCRPSWLSIEVLPYMTVEMPPFMAIYCSATLHDCLLQCHPSWLSIVVLPSMTVCCNAALHGYLL